MSDLFFMMSAKSSFDLLILISVAGVSLIAASHMNATRDLFFS